MSLLPIRLVVVIVLTIAILVAQFPTSNAEEAWTRAKDERMPAELRVVNEGIAHDDTHWYFTNQHFIYKTKQWPIEIEMANYKAIGEELTQKSYNHIGDVDVIDGLIIGGIEAKEGNGVLASWNTTDLSMIKYRVTEQRDMPWVAVDKASRRIFSCAWNDQAQLQIYDLDTFSFIGTLSVDTENNNPLLPKEIQGGAFYNGDLYLCTNVDDGIWKINITTGVVSFVLSDPIFEKYDYEMEGIDFWDLRHKGLGVMHVFGNFMTVLEKSVISYDPPTSTSKVEVAASGGSCSCQQYGGGTCSGFCNGNTCPCMNCEIVTQSC